jgi:tellurite resistance protein TerC
MTDLRFWIAFHIGVLVVLAVDLFGFRRGGGRVTMKSAAIWSAVWVGLSLGFNALIWHLKGSEKAVEFFTGYVIEYSLSVDNLFVFVLIFSYFQVPPRHQHRVLLWGILGALVMRGLVIWLGVKLVETFHWALYGFGLFLFVTGIRMFFGADSKTDLGENFVVRFCRRLLPVTPEFHGRHFVAKIDGRWMFTPLAVALVVVDVMDLVFAVDSIPAIFAITQDEFIIYTSNICAILGLRSLYFLLAEVVERFVYLRTGLAAILAFIGAKMLVADWIEIPTLLSLAIVALLLGSSIVASMLKIRAGESIQPAPPATKH